jgi:hypothetical protein
MRPEKSSVGPSTTQPRSKRRRQARPPTRRLSREYGGGATGAAPFRNQKARLRPSPAWERAGRALRRQSSRSLFDARSLGDNVGQVRVAGHGWRRLWLGGNQDGAFLATPESPRPAHETPVGAKLARHLRAHARAGRSLAHAAHLAPLPRRARTAEIRRPDPAESVEPAPPGPWSCPSPVRAAERRLRGPAGEQLEFAAAHSCDASPGGEGTPGGDGGTRRGGPGGGPNPGPGGGPPPGGGPNPGPGGGSGGRRAFISASVRRCSGVRSSRSSFSIRSLIACTLGQTSSKRSASTRARGAYPVAAKYLCPQVEVPARRGCSPRCRTKRPCPSRRR